MRGLAGKTALIVGAAPTNIGAATARRLADEGVVVMVSDIDANAARAVADEIAGTGASAHSGAVDLSSEASVLALVDSAIDQLGRIDCLFNVAAAVTPETSGVDGKHDVTTLPLDVWQRSFDVNLTGYMLTIRHVLPHMISANGGSIVNTMSGAAWSAEPIRLAYAASKLGIAALTRHTATVGGKHGVRCNAVSPGSIVTEKMRRIQTPEMLERQLERTATARLGRPDDIAAIVAFLFSDDAGFITGQVLAVDGGRSMRD